MSEVIPVWERLHEPSLGQLNDFRVFLYLVWKHLNLPKPTPSQIDIAKWLQEGPSETNGMMIIQAFRGIGKTWITVARVCHCLLLNPQLKVLVVSKSGQFAQQIIFLAKRLLREMPALQHLNPDLTDRNTVEYFDVAGAAPDPQPSVKALGIDGQLPGNRADIIIADDVETLSNCLSMGQREKLDRSVADFDAIKKPGGMIIFLGTPQIEDSLYARRAESGYTVRIWPARFPTAAQLENDKYRTRLAPWIISQWSKDTEWKPTDDRRFDDNDLKARELSYGRTAFMMQYMLDTQLSDAELHPLKLKDLITMAFSPDAGKCPISLIWSNDPKYCLMDPNLPLVGLTGDRFYAPGYVSDKWEVFDRIVMAVDPSGSGSDETAWAVVASFKGLLYCLGSGGFTEGHAPDTLESLALIAKKFGVHRIRIEKNFGDGMFTTLMRPYLTKHHPCEIVEERSVGQKERRMCDTLEPIIQSHRLVILEEVVKRDYKAPAEYQLLYQMTRLTREKGALRHDDRIEALSMAVADHVEYLAQDVSQTEEDILKAAQMKMMEDYLKELTEGVGGRTFGGDIGIRRYLH